MAEHAVQRDGDQASQKIQELKAVACIPEADARTVLYFLCDDDEMIRRKVLGIYQNIPKTDVCTNCEKEFDTDNNGPDACCYHPGDFELDEDLEFWDTIDDDDGNPYYERDSDANRKDCPEGFRWSCCERVGDVEGCEKGRHEAKGITTAEATAHSLALAVARIKARLSKAESMSRKEPGGEVPGEQSSNKRKAEEEFDDGDAAKAKKGADGYGLGIFE
ncbi:uncharacterized protein ColSpa_03130 [Colletotrichum spaethianum]|uniref:Uncharacterized protein n=1 Tax=Colletotrichum spaethianum TaxID=700344 RepID=A0AA37P7A9_9PEZI|nr:uncharacterized protein ColSpa_03130 [Colletotrichum spaethianum]GKT42949.1 hypothetical protein ColSpa_03130 [Colletotrichum spaethianum]